jgi:hypothetical protein
MKHAMAPALFTQLELQFDPLAIFGFAFAGRIIAARAATSKRVFTEK